MTCDFCKVPIKRKELSHSGNLKACPTCFEKTLITCERCGKRVPGSEVDGIAGFDLCANCTQDFIDNKLKGGLRK